MTKYKFDVLGAAIKFWQHGGGTGCDETWTDNGKCVVYFIFDRHINKTSSDIQWFPRMQLYYRCTLGVGISICSS